jgi:hypothetical protein
MAESQGYVSIFYINNHGGGFADYTEVKEGTTVESFFKDQFPEDDPANYLIRVNRDAVPAGYVLKEKDRVSVSPTKVAGALAA